MAKNHSKILILFLLTVIWTACGKSQVNDSITCLKNTRLIYLLGEQRDARFLRLDTTFKADKIEYLQRTINHQQSIVDRQESIVKLKDSEIDEYKSIYTDLIKKYNKQEKKLRNFKSGTLIFGSTTLILAGLFMVLN